LLGPGSTQNCGTSPRSPKNSISLGGSTLHRVAGADPPDQVTPPTAVKMNAVASVGIAMAYKLIDAAQARWGESGRNSGRRAATRSRPGRAGSGGPSLPTSPRPCRPPRHPIRHAPSWPSPERVALVGSRSSDALFLPHFRARLGQPGDDFFTAASTARVEARPPTVMRAAPSA
jgi:hypothetical protein